MPLADAAQKIYRGAQYDLAVAQRGRNKAQMKIATAVEARARETAVNEVAQEQSLRGSDPRAGVGHDPLEAGIPSQVA